VDLLNGSIEHVRRILELRRPGELGLARLQVSDAVLDVLLLGLELELLDEPGQVGCGLYAAWPK